MLNCFVNCQKENPRKATQVGSRVSPGGHGGLSGAPVTGSPAWHFSPGGPRLPSEPDLQPPLLTHLPLGAWQPPCKALTPSTSACKGLWAELQALQWSCCPRGQGVGRGQGSEIWAGTCGWWPTPQSYTAPCALTTVSVNLKKEEKRETLIDLGMIPQEKGRATRSSILA